MTCSTCNKQTDSEKTVIRSGQLFTGCDNCLNSQIQGGEFSAKSGRDWQRREFRKDLVQPNEPRDFSRAYPDKAREMYGDETARKYA